MPRIPTIWARKEAQLINYAVTRGIDLSQLLSHLGVEQKLLDDFDARLPLPIYYETLEFAEAQLGNPFFCIDYLSAVGARSIDAIGYLAMSTRTFGEGYELLRRHHRLLDDGSDFGFEVLGDRARFRCRCWGPDRSGRDQLAEMYAWGALPPVAMQRPLSVRFRHQPRPGTTLADYERRFGCLPEFGAEEDEWGLAREWLDRERPSPNVALVEFFEGYLQKREQAHQVPLTARVREAIARALPDADAKLETIAKRLGMSARNLQRGLAEEEQHFETILRDVRQAQACAYLRAGVPTAQVSYLLGYSDVATFHRAFARWTGLSPSAWRRQHAH